MPGLREFHQFGHNRGFGLEIHGEVGVIPIAHQAKAFELIALDVDPVLRVGAAFGTEFFDRHFVLVQLFLAIFLFDFPFDGQPVAIPAGHERRIFAEQALRTDDHVFQDALHRMANMHVAIGIGRAIVKDEFFASLTRGANLTVKIFGLPPRQKTRLLLRKASLHGKISLRQEDGVAPVFDGGVLLFSHVESGLRRQTPVPQACLARRHNPPRSA